MRLKLKIIICLLFGLCCHSKSKQSENKTQTYSGDSLKSTESRRTKENGNFLYRFEGSHIIKTDVWLKKRELNYPQKAKKIILKSGDYFYKLNNNQILTLDGFFFTDDSSLVMSKSKVNADTVFKINWSVENLYLYKNDEFAVFAKDSFKENINDYIFTIVTDHNASALIKYFNRYTFNHPTTEQFSILIFPLMSSFDDGELVKALNQLNKETLNSIRKELIFDNGRIEDSFKPYYLQNKFPLTYKFINS